MSSNLCVWWIKTKSENDITSLYDWEDLFQKLRQYIIKIDPCSKEIFKQEKTSNLFAASVIKEIASSIEKSKVVLKINLRDDNNQLEVNLSDIFYFHAATLELTALFVNVLHVYLQKGDKKELIRFIKNSTGQSKERSLAKYIVEEAKFTNTGENISAKVSLDTKETFIKAVEKLLLMVKGKGANTAPTAFTYSLSYSQLAFLLTLLSGFVTFKECLLFDHPLYYKHSDEREGEGWITLSNTLEKLVTVEFKTSQESLPSYTRTFGKALLEELPSFLECFQIKRKLGGIFWTERRDPLPSTDSKSKGIEFSPLKEEQYTSEMRLYQVIIPGKLINIEPIIASKVLGEDTPHEEMLCSADISNGKLISISFCDRKLFDCAFKTKEESEKPQHKSLPLTFQGSIKETLETKQGNTAPIVEKTKCGDIKTEDNKSKKNLQAWECFEHNETIDSLKKSQNSSWEKIGKNIDAKRIAIVQWKWELEYTFKENPYCCSKENSESEGEKDKKEQIKKEDWSNKRRLE